MAEGGRLSMLLELTRVRLLLFVREPEAMFWVFAFPVIMSVVLAFAFQDRGVEPSPVGVVAGDEGDLQARLEARADLEVRTYRDRAAGQHDLARGRIDVLVIPGTPPGLHLDDDRSEAVTARLRVLAALRGPVPDVLTPEEHPVEAVGSRYIDFLFPGLLGMNLMGTGIWGIGFFLVEQRQKKLLRRMLVTPMSRAAYLFSFVTSRMVFLALELVILCTFGLLVLDVPLLGSVVAFLGLCLFAAVAFVGLGLLVSSRARTVEAVSNVMNLVMMPMWLGSGVFFSYERFPEALHPLCRAMPLTAANDALRLVMLDGEGIGGILPELGVLLAWGAACYVVALRVFRWQ